MKVNQISHSQKTYSSSCHIVSPIVPVTRPEIEFRILCAHSEQKPSTGPDRYIIYYDRNQNQNNYGQ